MQVFVRKQSHKAGLPPGSLAPLVERREEAVNITIIDYRDDHYEEMETHRVAECLPFKEKPSVTWINVDGLHDLEILRRLGEGYDIHPLTLEDVVHTDHRPKMEDFGHYLYVTLKMLYLTPEETGVATEQVSLVVGRGFVISFQEAPEDVFGTVRERIKKASGRIRRRGADYLAYALMDAVVDQYFIILESLGEELESIEDELIDEPGKGILESIYTLRREVVLLRRSVWPLRETVSSLEKSESEIIEEPTKMYLRDLHDHTISILETVETFREMLAAMLDSFRSLAGERMNQVMKVLTIIATVFIPLTFIAGIYGMNFENMPELKWPWAYFAALGVMAAVAAAMVVYFKRKRWF